MSGFTEEALVNKLRELNCTLHSIQTLSLWLMHHRKHSQKTVDLWYKELRKEKKPQKLLNLLYLANDVIQNSRKKWPLFQEQFLGVLEKAFEHIAKYCEDKSLKPMKRVLQIWRERNVYSSASIEKITYAVTSNLTTKQLAMFSNEMAKTPPLEDTNTTTTTTITTIDSGKKDEEKKIKKNKLKAEKDLSAKGDSSSGSESPAITPATILSRSPRQLEPDPPTTEELIIALKKLEEPASADKDTRERIASFPEAVASPTLLKEITNNEQAERLYKLVKTAEPVVTEYCARLGEEIQHRKSVQEMLVSYLRAQKEKAEKTQDLLNQFRDKKDKLAIERQEVYKHYNSLPDLDKLPNTDQLPPLPSAGELFNR